MNSTYKAMQVTSTGVLALTELLVPTPGVGEVLIDVEACGICGADASDIEGARKQGKQRVPGHEVIGRIVAVGPHTPTMWSIGKRVGVGRLGGHCNECDQCRRGEFQLCRNQQVVGNTCDGGYAEMMLAKSTGLVAIPEELSSIEAAPLLCAGIATFNALRSSGAQAGDLVAIHGIGGLGHLAVQYARRMGFKVAAIGRRSDIAEDAMRLGAHVYIDARSDDAVARLQAMGGAQLLLTTTTDSADVSKLLGGLSLQGKHMVLGVGKEPLTVSPGFMVSGERVIQGSITGTPYESERALDFSILADVRPLVETMPLERAAEGQQRIASGQARFRIVLTMDAKS